MLLAGCLSYSNSAMNPVLYAFLSENFKKSFLKACTCATGRDANAVLHVENSAFPRKRTLLGGSVFKKYKERRRNRDGDGEDHGDHHKDGGRGHANDRGDHGGDKGDNRLR